MVSESKARPGDRRLLENLKLGSAPGRGRRERVRQLGRLVSYLALSCLGFALAACSSEESIPGFESSSDDSSERYFRRFLPFENRWRTASELPKKPQLKPKVILWETTGYAPDAQATEEQRQAAADLLAKCAQAAREHGWEDYDKGLADGYEVIPKDRNHFGKREYIFDDRVLDCDRPEFLMYYKTPLGRELTGFMFYTRTPLEHGPQIGGPLTLWHYHVWRQTACLVGGMLPVGIPATDGRCPEGHVPTHRSPEMLHIWFVDHPLGPYATSMRLPTSVLEEHLAGREEAEGQ